MIEAIITDLLSGRKYNLAEYVFQPKGNNLLMCYLQGMQWNNTADVCLILTAKNFGRWVHHFIKNMEKIVQETNDEHLHVIIYEFDSKDIDIKEAFQGTVLKNYHYITKPGNYPRARSFKEAIESAKDPDSIDASRHWKSIYQRNTRRYLLYIYIGAWYHDSYGTITMYKPDWNECGGFSQGFFQKTTGGGEDWDLIDKVFKGGLEYRKKSFTLGVSLLSFKSWHVEYC